MIDERKGSEALDLNSQKPWRIVFFGSDRFSLAALKALVDGPDDLVLVITPPAAPAGRGRKLTPSPVAELAKEMGLEILATKTVRAPQVIERIADAQPDLLVVSAYGGFLPEALLKMVKHPPLNVHPSVLPRHRGPAPVNWTLIQGDGQVGVSIIFLEKEMDAGPILRQRSFPVDSDESAGIWEDRLSQVGAEELLLAINDLKKGQAQIKIQDETAATVNGRLCKEDGRVDWQCSARQLAGLINGVDPWPGAQSLMDGKIIKLFGAEALETKGTSGSVGQVQGLDDRGRLLISTGQGLLAIREIQPEGKKRLSAADFLRGYHPSILGGGQ